jgi:glycosyltransferase involved in cell wall biosynthesis
MKSVSIVIPLWNRTVLLASTLVSIFNQRNLPPLEVIVVEDRPNDLSGQVLCQKYPIKYFKKNGTQRGYCNVGGVYNCGIKQATGEILIMQSAECKYETQTGIYDLVSAIQDDELASSVPLVQALGSNGEFGEWYCHPRAGGRPGWTGMFVHAVHRSQVLKVGGYDEIFQGYGFDDDLLLFRLKMNGVQPRHIETVLASHQWHPRHASLDKETRENQTIYVAKVLAIRQGLEPNIANIGHEWGVL